jgi:glycine betaine/choline ABC-type transport system substrate-binding protein
MVGECFLINPNGLINSNRKSQDKTVFIGSKESNENKVINDIVLSDE